MGKTIVSEDGRFEWDESKDRLNIKNGTTVFDVLTTYCM
jgi:uncharacterized DUF497 family protein